VVPTPGTLIFTPSLRIRHSAGNAITGTQTATLPIPWSVRESTLPAKYSGHIRGGPKDPNCVRATADIDQCYFEAKALRLSWAMAERVVILAPYKSDVLPRWGVAW
jgi:hypothetical protein